MDIDKALATWQKLLDTNPTYEGKDKVLELMAQAKKHAGVKRERRQSRCNNLPKLLASFPNALRGREH